MTYASESGLLIAGEVVNEQGDTRHIISEGMSYGDHEPLTNRPWGWQPLPGFDNPDRPVIAVSSDTTTWPPHWQAWPGSAGEGIISADLEAYWVMDDRDNAEFDYFPLSGDSSVQGLGIEVTGRAYQWTEAARENFIIFSYDIRNSGDKPLDKLVAGFYMDADVGGSGDFYDDRIAADLEQQAVFAFDSDGVGDQGRSPGIIAFVTLEAPDDLGLTSAAAPKFEAINPQNDEGLWQLLTPGKIDTVTEAADYVAVFGSGYFSLAPNETRRYAIGVIVLGTGIDEMRLAYGSLTAIDELHQAGFPATARLYQNYPNPFNPTTMIHYDLSKTAQIRLVIYNILGQQLRILVNGQQTAGSHSLRWDGMDMSGNPVSSGIYIYVLQTGTFSESRKMILIR